MKKLVLILLFVLTQVSWAQWEVANKGSLYGGDINTIAANNQFILAGTISGVFVSTDCGKIWIKKNSGLTKQHILSLAINGDYFYACTNGGGLFISSDNGNNWVQKNTGLTTTVPGPIIVSSDSIYIGSGIGFFLSTDNGETWSQKNTFPITSLAKEGSNIFAGTSKNGVYLSTDNGETWAEKNSGLTEMRIMNIVISGKNIFIGTYSNGIYRSTNNGDSWIQMNSGLTNNVIRSLALIENSVIVGTFGGGIFISNNFGETWIEKNNGLTNHSPYSIAVSGNNIYAGTSTSALFHSTDKCENWTQLDSRLTYTYLLNITKIDNKLYACSDREGVFVSSDTSDCWTQINTGLSSFRTGAIVKNESNLFLGTGNGVFMSSDSGSTWVPKNASMSKIFIYSMATKGDSILVGTEEHGIYLSTDSCNTWKLFGLKDYDIFTLAVKGNTIYAGTRIGLYLSTDNGTSWVQKKLGSKSDLLRSIRIYEDNIYAVQSNIIYISRNNGQDWTEFYSVFRGYENDTYFSDIAIFKNNIFTNVLTYRYNSYITTSITGVYLSKNNGVSWEQYNEGLTKSNLVDLVINGDYIYATSWGNGIFRAKLSDFGITDVKDEIISENNSFTVQPNPASDQITISLERCPTLSECWTSEEIQIYNSLGEKVMSVEMKNFSSLQINISNLPKGMYFVRIGNNAAKFVKM